MTPIMVANITDPVSGKTKLEQVLESSNGKEVQILIDLVSLAKLNAKSEFGTPNPYRDCVKHTRMIVAVNRNYRDSVNVQRLVEGKPTDFSSQPRRWGTIDGPFVRHEGQTYINSIVVNTGNSEYYHNGNPIDPEVIKPFRRKYNNTHTQQVNKEVDVRTILCSSVINFAIVN